MTGARLTAALECANDAGGRCALWPSGDAHACYGVSHDTATSCAFAAGSVSAARAALTGTGATPQSEGLVRVRTQVCFHTPAPVPWGRSRSNDPSREGCRASPGGTGQRSCLESHDANPSIVARAGGTVERCSGKSRSPSLSSIGSESIHPLRLRGGDLLAVV